MRCRLILKEMFRDSVSESDGIIQYVKLLLKFMIYPGQPEQRLIPWIRLAGFGDLSKHKLLRKFINNHIYYQYHCNISPNANISVGLHIPHPIGVVIGEGVVIGKNCSIYQQVTLGQNRGEYPAIGDDVVIYSGAKIIGNIHVGNGAVVGANAVITKNVNDFEIVAGVPAKVVGLRTKEMDIY